MHKTVKLLIDYFQQAVVFIEAMDYSMFCSSSCVQKLMDEAAF